MLRNDGSVFSLKPQLSLKLQPDSGELGMLRKVILKLSLEPQPDSGELGMLRKLILKLSPTPQPDSGGLGILRKVEFVLPPKPQPDSRDPENSEASKAWNGFLEIDI